MTRVRRNASTIAELIDLLGGNEAVARYTGKTPNAVRVWRQRGHFPAHTLDNIRSAVEASHITAARALLEPRRYRRQPANGADCVTP